MAPAIERSNVIKMEDRTPSIEARLKERAGVAEKLGLDSEADNLLGRALSHRRTGNAIIEIKKKRAR